jgi:hypothetical protein
MSIKNTKTKSMSFFHTNGMISAWNLAIKFAGKNGKIATMEDIVNARLNNDLNSTEWNSYYTTLSAEYVGIGSDGRLKLIVAHGIGPMSELEGIIKAYSYSYNDPSRKTNGGLITSIEFLKLENGFYGKVEIVDLDDYLYRFDQKTDFAFLGILKENTEYNDPVLRARLGNNYLRYIRKCRELSNQCKKDNPTLNGQILEIACGDIYYSHNKPEDGFAFANLLSIDRLSISHHDHGILSLVHDITCHGWYDGTRLVAINSKSDCLKINPGFNYIQSVKNSESRKNMLIKSHGNDLPRMSLIVNINANIWFTQTPKVGESMNTGILEFPVKNITKIGDITTFTTSIGGYYGFVKYSTNEVISVAPDNANAYQYIDTKIVKINDTDYHEVYVQFYSIEADTSVSILGEKEICKDLDLMLKLIELYS